MHRVEVHREVGHALVGGASYVRRRYRDVGTAGRSNQTFDFVLCVASIQPVKPLGFAARFRKVASPFRMLGIVANLARKFDGAPRYVGTTGERSSAR